ncbi:hypothetical protein ACFLRB_02295 [Acidobacteriota bacterium]
MQVDQLAEQVILFFLQMNHFIIQIDEDLPQVHLLMKQGMETQNFASLRFSEKIMIKRNAKENKNQYCRDGKSSVSEAFRK